VSTVCDQPTRRAPLPTNHGRATQAAIDAAPRPVIAGKGFLATTITDIAAEEAMIREWAKPVIRHGLSARGRAHQAALLPGGRPR
jgi:hypothetical protein